MRICAASKFFRIINGSIFFFFKYSKGNVWLLRKMNGGSLRFVFILGKTQKKKNKMSVQVGSLFLFCVCVYSDDEREKRREKWGKRRENRGKRKE